MEKRRSSSRQAKTKPRTSPARRRNNIILFKLIDPIVQSLLIIFFVYCLDTDSETQYQTVLAFLVGWQLATGIANLLLKPEEQLKSQRITALVVMIVYCIIGNLILARVTEKTITITDVIDITLPLYDSLMQLGLLIIAFWYYVICFREIRALLTSVTNQAS